MPQIAAQLIIFGKLSGEDPDKMFGEVKASGFPAVEAGNLIAAYGEAEARRLVAQYEIGLSGMHSGYGAYADPAQLEADLAFAKQFGVKNFLCSGVAAGNSVEAYRESAKTFNTVGRRLQAEGITFHYHNHDWEFADLGDGTRGMDILAQETDPEIVKFNLDVFWLYYAEQDVETFIRTHAERTGYFHFKDGRIVRDEEGNKRPDFLELGEGDVDLKTAYAAAIESGAAWIVAEQDSTKREPVESLTISRNYLRLLAGQ